jgi:Spy/CpxP family protein refolding chaperone
MSPKERAANMKEQLALTDSQAVLVTGIFEDAQADMKKAADSADGDRRSMRDLRMAIMKKSDERIDSILTDDQKKKFADMKKERQGRMRNRQRND